MSRRVVLPAPLEPTSPVTEPAGTVILICQTARVGPKKRVTPVTSMLMGTCYGGSGPWSHIPMGRSPRRLAPRVGGRRGPGPCGRARFGAPRAIR